MKTTTLTFSRTKLIHETRYWNEVSIEGELWFVYGDLPCYIAIESVLPLLDSVTADQLELDTFELLIPA